MNPVMSLCPVCESELSVSRLHCAACDTTIQGRFSPGPFARLSAEQLVFVEAFVRCEGKLSHLEGELGMSYPTLRSRLHEIIRAMGHLPRGQSEPDGAALAESRRDILQALDEGVIDAETAMAQLKALGD